MRTDVVPLLRLRTPEDLLAAVPYLLGFHPADSLVVLGMCDTRLVLSMRGDLPPAGTPVKREAAHLAHVLARQDVDTVVVIGYGPGDRVTPLALAARSRFHARGIRVADMIRACDGRYWSYVCQSPECCAPEGTAYDLAGSRIAAEATFAGQVALPDREALARHLAPPEGAALAAMERAAEQAQQRLTALLDGAPDQAATFVSVGVDVVSRALRRYETGGRLTDDEVAELSVLLRSTEVRDAAWEPIGPGAGQPELSTMELHVRLWSDVVRRACPGTVAPAASLLAYAAWRTGDGITAGIAVDRALAADPAYTMALLMAELLHRAIPPDGAGPVHAPGQRRRRRTRRPARR